MDLVSVSPVFNLYDKAVADAHSQAAISARQVRLRRSRPHGQAHDSIVSMGCIVSGGFGHELLALPDVRVNSYTQVDDSILFSHVTSVATAESAAPSSTAMSICPREPSSATTPRPTDKVLRHRSGITVVTRDYSLFENPVSVDYFTSE